MHGAGCSPVQVQLRSLKQCLCYERGWQTTEHINQGCNSMCVYLVSAAGARSVSPASALHRPSNSQKVATARQQLAPRSAAPDTGRLSACSLSPAAGYPACLKALHSA